MEKYVDLIILLNGGFVPISHINTEQKQDLYITLNRCIAGTYDNPCLFLGDAVVKASSIVGFYFRSPTKNPVELMQELVDKVDKPDDGDSWKNG